MTYDAERIRRLDAAGIAQCSPAHIENVINELIQTTLETQAKFESLHQHISHLRSVIYPAKMLDSAAWRAVPVKHLSAIQSLMDPPPVKVGDQMMVFVNPYAAECMTRISAEFKAMLEAVPPTPPEAE